MRKRSFGDKNSPSSTSQSPRQSTRNMDKDATGTPAQGSSQIHSRCVQVDIRDMTTAVSIFSQKSSDGTIPLVLIPTNRGKFSFSMYVPSGCNCLLQYCGKDAGLAAPGLRFSMPWYRIAYIVTKQSSTYNAPVQQCPTADNVMVHVDVTVVFNIREPKDFVYKLGATKFDSFLAGAVDEGIRVLVRGQLHNEVYQLRGNRAGNLLSLLNQKFEMYGLSFTDCKITSVWLPPTLSKSLENARTMEIKEQGEVKRHEFECLRISQEFERQIEKIRKENEQLKVQEDGKKRIHEMERDQRTTECNKKMREAVLLAESQANVKKTDAQNQLENAKVVFEKDKLLLVAEALREAHATKAAADIYRGEEITRAQGDLATMKAEAERIRLEAEVEAASIANLASQREFELKKMEKSIIAEFAKSGDFKFIGNHGDMMLASLMKGEFKGPQLAQMG